MIVNMINKSVKKGNYNERERKRMCIEKTGKRK